jgi:hypothetical protein
VSCLVSAILYDGPTGGGTQKQQSYTFDAFGNLTNITGTRNRPVSQPRLRVQGVSDHDRGSTLRSERTHPLLSLKRKHR